MKKLFAVALSSLAALGLSGGQAVAGWFFHHHCSCDVVLHCRQYNAFSPPCCGGDFGPGGGCGPGYAGAWGSGAMAPGWVGQAAQLGQFPANAWPNAFAGQPVPMPGSGMMAPNPPLASSLGNAPALVPGNNPQTPFGLIRPGGPTFSYPMVNPGYAPANSPPTLSQDHEGSTQE